MISLSACSTTPKTVVVDVPKYDDTFVCKVPFNPPKPAPVIWEPVTFYVINDYQATDGRDIPKNLIAMDHISYQNLSLNIRQIINHMIESRLIYEKTNSYYQK